MNLAQLKRFAEEWFAEWAVDPPIHGSATRTLEDAIEDQPEVAWQMILALVEHAPNDDSLDWVGAGPVEDLLSAHGVFVISQVEEEAAKNLHFKKCLTFVWGQNRIEGPIYARIQTARAEA